MSITWVGQSVWEEAPAPPGQIRYTLTRAVTVNICDLTFPGHDIPCTITEHRAGTSVLEGGSGDPGAANFDMRRPGPDNIASHQRRRCLLDDRMLTVRRSDGNEVELAADDGEWMVRSRLWVRLWTEVVDER